MMKYVYVIQSMRRADQYYVGHTRNLNRRLRAHNFGQSPHTSRFKPWDLLVAFKIPNDEKALALEKYLKSGSGRAFVNRHFK